MLTRTLPVAALLILCGSSPIQAQSGWTPTPARHGMVATSHYLASEVGRDVMMNHGGNAVDAAVAAAFALAVVYPSAGNIGGGGFMLYHGADGMATSFNFREKAPLAASSRMYLDDEGEIWNKSNHEGLLSVGVPGTVAGLKLAHDRLGSLPWKDLVQPAIDLAETGFPVDWYLRRFMEWVEEHRVKVPSTARVFLDSTGAAIEPGEMLRQSNLAATLRRVQAEGKDGFYKGETARLIVQFMRENGGLITHEDLARYEAVEQPPLKGTYRGHHVYGMAPPSSGGVAVIEMLNILEGYELSELGHNSAAYMHVLTEAMRRAYADRALHLGDPLFNPDMPVDRLISKEHAALLRSTIDMNRASVSDSVYFNDSYESPETTHISVLDSMGNAVSLTYTLEYSYGSKIVVDGAGFLLNNEMGDFNAVPGSTNARGRIGTRPNLIEPEKRMLSSMSPTIVTRNGVPFLVIGSPGGRTIINTVLQVVLNVLDHNMNIAEAINAGRFHHQWFPDTTYVEPFAISPDTWKLYESLGHATKVRTYRGKPSTQGQAMGILIDPGDGMIYGAADSRGLTSRAVGY